MILEIVKKFLPKKILENLSKFKAFSFIYAKITYSQEGEDIILSRIFANKRDGFFVDVGAHHPYRFSNTYVFYKRGWRGINIEPNPFSIKLFEKYRKRDINLNIAISKNKGKLVYFLFDEPALNTCDEKVVQTRIHLNRVIEKREVECFSLEEVLDKYLPKDQKIDFLTIDCEGLDFEILQSNNWEKYLPIVILVEVIPANTMEEILSNPIYQYLRQKKYLLFTKLFNTCVFVLEEFIQIAKKGELN